MTDNVTPFRPRPHTPHPMSVSLVHLQGIEGSVALIVSLLQGQPGVDYVALEVAKMDILNGMDVIKRTVTAIGLQIPPDQPS